LLFIRTRLAETVAGDADPMTTELIGWVIRGHPAGDDRHCRSTDNGATAVLKGDTEVLFVGQITASAGFEIYSWLSLWLSANDCSRVRGEI
jgi:hypothetical protein